MLLIYISLFLCLVGVSALVLRIDAQCLLYGKPPVMQNSTAFQTPAVLARVRTIADLQNQNAAAKDMENALLVMNFHSQVSLFRQL